MSIFCVVDDKHIPLYRILWVAATPHFCGHEDCTQEGNYEIRLEQGESVWAKREERDTVLEALEQWQGGVGEGRRRKLGRRRIVASRRSPGVLHCRLAGAKRVPQAIAMSTFEEHGYKWRETYFVMFPAARRPTLAKVERLLKTLSPAVRACERRGRRKGTLRIAYDPRPARLRRHGYQL